VLIECNNSIKKLINSYEIFNIEASSTVLKLINLTKGLMMVIFT